jgi:hypothetical protein
VQISKKLNKYNFYETKNFTGIRWINPKSFPGEMKKLLENHFNQIVNYFENKYFNCRSSVPEFILENYNFVFNKLNEVKRIFSKFYIFKGIKKFFRCMMKYNNTFNPHHFGENLLTGKITIKKLLTNLKNIILAIMEIIKGAHIDTYAKNLKKIILSLKGLPGL